MIGRRRMRGHGPRITAGAEPACRSNVQRTLDVLPFLIMGAVAIAAARIGPDTELLPLLSLGPAFAAVSGGLRKTVVVGVVALALCAVLAAYQIISTWDKYALDSATVAGVTVAAVIASTVRQRRECELAEVRAIAEVAQQVLLGPVPRQVDSIRLAVRYMSATSHAQIGGDLYAVVTALGGCRLIVGDVQGKGLISVKTAAAVLGAFREVAHDAADLPMIAERIEASLARRLTAEQFVTALLAEISSDGSKVQLLSCGHPPPLLITGGTGRFVEPADCSLPLGLAHLAAFPRDVTTVPFDPGDQLLLYTDGVSEARNRAGEFYPLAQRGVFRADQDPDAILHVLQQDVLRHVGHALDDDAAMLLIQREPASIRPASAAIPAGWGELARASLDGLPRFPHAR
ncbi:MAG TPA: PP2C family protein-serine/threonine phosphatase [Streptosporangiaceae bacterium]|nr:PP2C family protein-serine/threonine phosphatase [Streptosporangiaceae bacterium]